MSCDVTKGRAWECKGNIGGIKTVYFANYNDLTGLTVSNGAIANLDGSTLYKYELPEGVGSLNTDMQVSTESGTFVAEQVLTMALYKLTAADRDEIRLLAIGRPKIVVEDNDGTMWLVGLNDGANVTAGSANTGQSKNDLYGYNLTFTAREKELPPIVTSLGTATIVTS